MINQTYAPKVGKIIEFIESSPYSIQYIITSRYEEKVGKSLHLEGFSNNIRGYVKRDIGKNLIARFW